MNMNMNIHINRGLLTDIIAGRCSASAARRELCGAVVEAAEAAQRVCPEKHIPTAANGICVGDPLTECNAHNT